MNKLLITLIIASTLAQNTHAAKNLALSLGRLKINPYATSSMKFLAPDTNVRWFSSPTKQNKETRHQQQQKRLQKIEATKAYNSIAEVLSEFNTIIKYMKANKDKLTKENFEKAKELSEKIRALLTEVESACKEDKSLLEKPESALHIKKCIETCVGILIIILTGAALYQQSQSSLNGYNLSDVMRLKSV